MVPEFVERIRGSKWQSALPTRKTADLGRSDLWRPTVVDKTRGSNRNRALPGYSRQMVTPRPRKMRTRTVQP